MCTLSDSESLESASTSELVQRIERCGREGGKYSSLGLFGSRSRRAYPAVKPRCAKGTFYKKKYEGGALKLISTGEVRAKSCTGNFHKGNYRTRFTLLVGVGSEGAGKYFLEKRSGSHTTRTGSLNWGQRTGSKDTGRYGVKKGNP